MANYMVLIDGMPDEPSPLLGNQTPLEYADCYILQQLEQNGSHGLFTTCPPGYIAESMTCIMTLLGVAPPFLPKGRAYLEAVAQDVAVANDDLLLRCNLVALKNGIVVSSSANSLHAEQTLQAAKLVEAMARPLGLRLLHMQDYKNLLMIKGGKAAGEALQTIAPHENLNQPWDYFLPKGNKLGQLLTQFVIQSKKQLKDYWGDTGYEYMMVPWGQSFYQPIPAFTKLFHRKGTIVCGTEIVKGIGKVMGLPVETIPGATADVDTDLKAKADVAISCSQRCDMVLIHVNGADEAGHRRNPKEKAAFLQRVDSELIKTLIENINSGDRVLVCSDHGTSSVTGKHMDTAQPFLLYEEGGDNRQNYGVVNGMHAVPLLLNQYKV